jgi:cyclopropane-fatty-acyl-phospholipid synthase
MFKPLQIVLDRVVRLGNLTFVDSKGGRFTFGDGTGIPVAVRLADKKLERALVVDPELAAGEGYMQSRLVMEQGTAYDFIALMMRNMAEHPLPPWTQSFSRTRKVLRRVLTHNPVQRARRNVAHHYDIDPRIYDLFLDRDRQYSCAYFTPGADLEHAQLAKKRHIAAKLRLAPGHKVLDIGSGWGGLAFYLAEKAGAEVTGITLSSEQLAHSRERARKSRVSNAVAFDLMDYREVTGRFDRIVSVGMFEHVGVACYDIFFATLRKLLADDGVALLHTIGRTDEPSATNPFIAKYIFPGGYLPSLSEIMAAIERSGLMVCDVEVLRLHYAETLRAWRERFLARRDEAVAIAGEEFTRMWEFYLAGCEASFRYQNLVVFQIQAARRVDTLPTARDYMLETERRLAARDGGIDERPRLAGE